MYKSYTALFIAFIFFNSTNAQHVKPLNQYYYTLSYFGEKVFNAGVQLSINRTSYLFKNANTYKNRFDLGLSTSAYFHKKNHTGLRVTPKVSFIYTNKKIFEYGIKADVGFMRRFYQGKVFEVDNNGNVTKPYLAGQNSFTYGVYLIFIKNWYSTKFKNIRLFTEIGGFQETKYNNSSLLHPTINIGFGKYFKYKK